MKGKYVLPLSVLAGIYSYIISEDAFATTATPQSTFYTLQHAPSATSEHFLSILPDKYQDYQVFVHSSVMHDKIKNDYSVTQLEDIRKLTENSRKMVLTEKPWGTFILASNFDDPQTGSETHYDAVWLRDSLWGYLALNSQQQNQSAAKKVLLTLWDYMSSADQLTRMNNVIVNPELLNGPQGQMNAVHIRFDSNSAAMMDVQENGRPQPWNHKQNDALGLYLDLLLQAVSSGQIQPADWKKNNRLQSLALLIAYLEKINFHTMEDSGAWEEDARLNTSSIALVTSGLEQLLELVSAESQDNATAFIADLVAQAKENDLDEFLSKERLIQQVDKGYERIILQLDLGGESPSYPESDKRYRTADAALLNIIYPARLSKITVQQKEQVLQIVRSLAGPYGIKRYNNDNYQSANFWFNDIKTDTEADSHLKRVQSFIPLTEAEWFFDSWYAKSAAMIYQETKDAYFLSEAIQFMNRSLAQITGSNMIGANGRPVPEMSLPESYNYLHVSGRLHEVPSPIIPLNWSKSSMTLMFDEVNASLKTRDALKLVKIP